MTPWVLLGHSSRARPVALVVVIAAQGPNILCDVVTAGSARGDVVGVAQPPPQAVLRLLGNRGKLLVRRSGASHTWHARDLVEQFFVDDSHLFHRAPI